MNQAFAESVLRMLHAADETMPLASDLDADAFPHAREIRTRALDAVQAYDELPDVWMALRQQEDFTTGRLISRLRDAVRHDAAAATSMHTLVNEHRQRIGQSPTPGPNLEQVRTRVDAALDPLDAEWAEYERHHNATREFLVTEGLLVEQDAGYRLSQRGLQVLNTKPDWLKGPKTFRDVIFEVLPKKPEDYVTIAMAIFKGAAG